MPVKRDLGIENWAVGVFRGQNNGKMPDLNNPNERATVYKMAYPTELPDELKGTVDESLLYSGNQKPTTQITPNLNNQPSTNLNDLGNKLVGAEKTYDQFSQPNEAMRILQESIRTVSGAKQEPIGTSKIFEQAGVKGMGALSASLASRSQEMEMNHAEFSNIVGQLAGNYSDAANKALERYKMAREDYNNEKTRLEEIDKEARDYERQINLLHEKSKIDQELSSIPSYAEQVSGLEKGYTNVGGMPVKTDGTFDPITGAPTIPSKVLSAGDKSYNFTSYAKDLEWGGSVNAILKELSSFNGNKEEIEKAIKSKYPNSILKVSDIDTVANETGVNPELLLAIAAHESAFGTSSVAMANNNLVGFSNVGTTGTNRPQAEGGTYTKFSKPIDSLRALANNILRREIDTTQQKSKFKQFSDEQLALNTMPVQTRNSDYESKRALQGINEGLKEGKTPFQVADEVMGFVIKNPNEFSDTVRGFISQNEKVSPSDPSEFARMINNNNLSGVVNKLENTALKGTDVKEKYEPLARFMTEYGDRTIDSINSQLNKMGIIAGNWEKQAKKFVSSPEFQSLSSKLTGLTAEWRKNLIGTAATENELKFIDDLVPKVKDNPFNAIAKIKELQNSNLSLLNSKRETYNLPKVDKETLLDLNKRASLYSGQSNIENKQSKIIIAPDGQEIEIID